MPIVRHQVNTRRSTPSFVGVAAANQSLLPIRPTRHLIVLCFVLAGLFLNACGAKEEFVITDPYEEENRIFLRGLEKTDVHVLRPASIFYRDRINDTVQSGVRNFINNLETGKHAFNDLLQLRMHRFFYDSARLIINSTAGILGFINVAERLGLEFEPNDFGKTLARWGWRRSAYLVVYLQGVTNVRDQFGTLIEYFALHPTLFLNFNHYDLLIYEILRAVNSRIRLLNAESIIDDPSVIDRYALIREIANESRILLLKRKDGAASAEDIWSDDDLDLLD